MALKEPTFTFGIEEEYHLIDVETRELADAPQALMAACEEALGGQVAPEFLRTQIEVGTKPCRTIAEAREQLSALRATIGRLAHEHGMAPVASATHPLARARTLKTTEKERYQALARDLAGVGRRLAICGMHVHVGIEDEDTRIELMNHLRYFVPHLLMLSTSSPFWEGENTGLKSYRLAVMHELPRTGMPGRFQSWNDYAHTIEVLTSAGIIEDGSKIWWDIRPSARFPTLEMRIPDVCTRLDDALAIAAIYVCLARRLFRLRRANQSWRTYPVFLLEENRWRAQRYGVSESLFDFGKGQLVPFAELVDELITLVGEDAEAMGCTAEVAHARDIVARGTSADRQVELYEKSLAAGASQQLALHAVIDWLAAQTLEF
ncbi:MAG: hypothetical protein RLZ98_540 [Pseudomonadota bacterium]|jgi:carboxylate-amine ligase